LKKSSRGSDWKVKFSDAGERALLRLPHAVQTRILAFLHERVARHPHPQDLAVRLQNRDKAWRFRVGDYRIIADIFKGEMVVLVIDMGHRREIYDR
jgi:mRNA interferase RelE/StbE